MGGACATVDPRSSCSPAPRRPPGRGTRCTASAPWSLSGRPYGPPEEDQEVKRCFNYFVLFFLLKYDNNQHLVC